MQSEFSKSYSQPANKRFREIQINRPNRGQGLHLEPALLQSMNTCLDSCHLAKPLLVANSPHPTHDAARPFGNRQGPTHSCWSRRRVFGRTPQLSGVPRKTINPQNAVSSTATVAHKTVRVLQRARMKQGDALKTLKCSLRTNARNVQRSPTVSNPRPERRVSMRHIISEVAQVARAHRFAHCSSKPSVTRFSLVPMCSCVMRPC